MTDSNALVEHFFRHESANLVAVLTRAFGVSRLELIEDSVQTALLEAMHSWPRSGVPENPAGWVHRAARNRILDALRREKVHQRAVAFSGQSASQTESLLDEWLDADQLSDSLLRMMFVCCHPSLDRTSQIAITLKILCGFGTGEIARGLLITPEAAAKRVQRARKALAEQNVPLDPPTGDELHSRLDAVHDVLYLTFNEGYSTSTGDDPIRDDLCEEAARICHLLCENEALSSPTTRALLALMLFHGARLDSRTDAAGGTILLEDQDRSLWDRELMHVADSWLCRSETDRVSRFHLEAAIAQQHCHAQSVAETNWELIIRFYDRLIAAVPSPLYRLNRAIARGQLGDLEHAFAELDAIESEKAMTNYFLLDCARARLHELAGDTASAIACYERALEKNVAPHEAEVVGRGLKRLR